MKFQDALDKSFALTEAVQKNLWDMYAVGMGTITWGQAQYDKMVQKFLDQNKQIREDMSEYVDSAIKQAKEGQNGMRNMFKEAADIACENAEYPGYKYYEDMNNRIQKLYDKVFSTEEN